jgi:peptide chain release factor subunit 1
MSVRGDIQRIREALGSDRWPPGGVAIFSCSGRGLYEEILLPRRVREQIIADATPFARPMLAVLGEYHRACVLVINKASARVWEIDQDEMHEVSTVRDPVLRKPDYAAGLAEDRVRNKAEELGKRHFRRVVKLMEDLLRTDGYEIVVIGGHDYEIPEFLQFLSLELRDRVAGTFSADPATATLAEIKKSARSILERYEREQQQRLISRVLEKAAIGGPAALGLEDCLQAGSMAAVNTLLVQEGAIAAGVVCDESGWLATSGDTCPVCGNPTRRTPDVIDELVTVVIDEGGSTRQIEAGTQLSEYLVAAELRFPLPPTPTESP